MAPPGSCRPSAAQQLRILPRLLPNDPRAAFRSLLRPDTWSACDPEERHWHLGPMAVDAGLQRMGIGSLLMLPFCAQMDGAGDHAYLATDRPANVRFYERFGFEAVGEQEALGTTHWFMRRPTREKR
jgi:ribosomal protein S18 acetylase RimI-like enzyme